MHSPLLPLCWTLLNPNGFAGTGKTREKYGLGRASDRIHNWGGARWRKQSVGFFGFQGHLQMTFDRPPGRSCLSLTPAAVMRWREIDSTSRSREADWQGPSLRAVRRVAGEGSWGFCPSRGGAEFPTGPPGGRSLYPGASRRSSSGNRRHQALTFFVPRPRDGQSVCRAGDGRHGVGGAPVSRHPRARRLLIFFSPAQILRTRKAGCRLS